MTHPTEGYGTPPFEPDILLPAQLGSASCRNRVLHGERLLMLAVLEDAVECYRTHRRALTPYARRLFEETRKWLDSTDRSALFSFETICDALEIHPDYIRRRVRDWRGPARPGRRIGP
jgi:hypothetical protein